MLSARAAPDVPDVRADPEPAQVGYRPDGADGRGRKLSFGAVLFEGRLRVTDAAAFHRTLEQGVGSGKAYGFGLLSVAPAR